MPNKTMEYGVNNHTERSVTWVQHVLVPSLFLGACFLVGVPGNAFVIWTILCKIPQRSLTMVLILNLAVADFIVLITLPLWIHALADRWVYGLYVCQLLTYAIYCTMYASVFFLTLMSIQRFSVVVFPFTSRRWQNKNTVYGMVLTVWVLSLVFSSPVFVFRSTVEINGTVQCSSWEYASVTQEITDLSVKLVTSFVIPFLILTVCYTMVLRRVRRLQFKGKSKTGTLIVSMVLAFFACWFPFHIVNVFIISALSLRPSHPDTARNLNNVARAGETIAGALVFFSSCLNPILYAFAARSFHGGLRGVHFGKLFGQMNEDPVEKTTEDTPMSCGNRNVLLRDI